MTELKAPEIKTERLILRVLTLTDAPAMYSYRSDPEVMRHQPWNPTSETEIQTFIRKNRKLRFNTANTWVQLGIYLKATNELIGDIGIHFLPLDNWQVEIGFTISPKHQGKGFATEAVKQLLNYLFNNLEKHRVIASVDPANTASIRLLERIGMRKEGHFLKSIWNGKEWADDITYAILREEWPASQ